MFGAGIADSWEPAPVYLPDTSDDISARYGGQVGENRTRYAILGALTLKPMSGYDIKQFADQSVAHFWAESYGQIYPILKQLLAERLITVDAERRAGGRRHVRYAITERGRRALAEWLAEPAEQQVGRIEILLKLFFARNAAPEVIVQLVETFRGEHVARLERYHAIEEGLQDEHADHPDLPYWLMTLSYGRQVSRALVTWADETLSALKRLVRRSRTSERI
jgi:PadR family transcriptional regulator, regulatory protein AphA